MGRLLDIARTFAIPKAAPTTRAISEIPSLKQRERPAAQVPGAGAKSAVSARTPLMEYNSAAAEVLGILIATGIPVSHSTLVRQLESRHYNKAAARKAIDICRISGWIEHSLVSGFVLSEVEPKEVM